MVVGETDRCVSYVAAHGTTSCGASMGASSRFESEREGEHCVDCDCASEELAVVQKPAVGEGVGALKRAPHQDHRHLQERSSDSPWAVPRSEDAEERARKLAMFVSGRSPAFPRVWEWCPNDASTASEEQTVRGSLRASRVRAVPPKTSDFPKMPLSTQRHVSTAPTIFKGTVAKCCFLEKDV